MRVKPFCFVSFPLFAARALPPPALVMLEVGIFGGSRDYTGAPYYAGASHVVDKRLGSFCSEGIKALGVLAATGAARTGGAKNWSRVGLRLYRRRSCTSHQVLQSRTHGDPGLQRGSQDVKKRMSNDLQWFGRF